MLVSVLFAACSPAPEAEVGAPTWHADVAPILVARCAGCHVEGGIAPFALDSQASAAAMADAASAAVQAGTMPPFDAYETEDCTPTLGWQDDPRLTDEEKDTLAAWAEAGAPEGDPATAAGLPSPVVSELAGATAELAPEESYTTAGSQDEFMCVSIDAGLTTDAWFSGLEVLPGNERVVHHVVVVSDPHAETAAWGSAYRSCFQLPAITDSQALAVWVPGSPPTELPDSSGIPLAAGARLVMQLHYHPAGEVAEPDLTRLRIATGPTAPEWQAILFGLGNFATEAEGLQPGPGDRSETEFRIPKNVPDHTETEIFTTEAGETDFYFFSVQPHLHMVGTDMQIRWQREEPRQSEAEDECLLQSRWRFEWQRSYTYAAERIIDLPRGRGGDTLWMQCRYDNTLDNPGVRRALADAGLDEPVNVELGEGSLDEMCIGIFGAVYR